MVLSRVGAFFIPRQKTKMILGTVDTSSENLKNIFYNFICKAGSVYFSYVWRSKGSRTMISGHRPSVNYIDVSGIMTFTQPYLFGIYMAKQRFAAISFNPSRFRICLHGTLNKYPVFRKNCFHVLSKCCYN